MMPFKVSNKWILQIRPKLFNVLYFQARFQFHTLRISVFKFLLLVQQIKIKSCIDGRVNLRQIYLSYIQVNLCQKLFFLKIMGRTFCVQKLFPTFRTIFVNNMFSPCFAKRRASDKDLPVLGRHWASSCSPALVNEEGWLTSQQRIMNHL